jgi:hypothetical protein
VSEIGTPITDFTDAGTLDGTEIVPLVRPGLNVRSTLDDILALSSTPGWKVVPYTQDVLTDQTATMTATINEVDDADGAVIVVPGGTFYSKIRIGGQAGLTFRGAGKLATTIVGPAGTGSIIEIADDYTRGGCTFEDMTFDLTDSFRAMIMYSEDRNTTFRRCRFINITEDGYAITAQGAIHPVFEDCEFDDGGQAVGTAISVNLATRGLRWIRSTARFLRNGIIFDVSPHDDIDIDGGLFDGGFYLLPTRPGGYTNSGGTVTYTLTTVTDSAASFGDVTNSDIINVRALPVLESGSTGTVYQYNYVEDAAATFETAVVRPGYIIRTADKWAVVESVASETRLYVEEWFDSTTYRPIEQPLADTAYNVYRVLIGHITANTATEITVGRWIDFYDGDDDTPAAGTLYEVLIDHGGYSGIHAASTPTSDAAGGIKDIRIHGGCHITRVWNDQLSIYGQDARLTVDSTVLIDHGQDFGITCHGERARIFCTVVHNGACNIYATGADSRIDAFVSGAQWVNVANVLWLGDLVISGPRTRATGSVAVSAGPYSRYGIVVACLAGPDLEDVDVSGTSSSGYPTAEYRLYGFSAGKVANTVMRDVSGVISETNAVGTNTWNSTSELQTTVGAAGGASALPATPTKYIKVTVAGTDYVFPAYAVS